MNYFDFLKIVTYSKRITLYDHIMNLKPFTYRTLETVLEFLALSFYYLCLSFVYCFCICTVCYFYVCLFMLFLRLIFNNFNHQKVFFGVHS